eukprot:gene7810-9613_t
MALKCVEINPTEKHTATIIFLHGLMDTGAGWKEPMLMLQAYGGMSHIKVILPTAPIIPVTLNMGMKGTAWFDITSLNPGGHEDTVNLDKNMNLIKDIIKKEQENGIPINRIILGGFSQGAALTLYTSYQLEQQLAGILSLSGFVPALSLLDKINPESKTIPAIMFHGTEDKVVNSKWGELSHTHLKKAGVEVQFVPIPGMGHSVCEDELVKMSDFIKKNLPKL